MFPIDSFFDWIIAWLIVCLIVCMRIVLCIMFPVSMGSLYGLSNVYLDCKARGKKDLLFQI